MRVQRTALMRLAEQKLPVVGDYYVREIPPSDNVSALLGSARRIGANVPVYSRSDIFANEKRHMRRALVADSEAFLGGEGQRVGVVHKNHRLLLLGYQFLRLRVHFNDQ